VIRDPDRAVLPSFPFSAAIDAAGVRRNERRFDALTRTFSDFVWLADADGNLVSDMPQWRRVTGQSVEALLGQGWLGGVHADDRAHVKAAWESALATAEPYEVSYRITGPGQERWCEVRGAPVLGDDGVVLEWIGTAVDVTDRHTAEELRQVLGETVDRERETLKQVIAQAPSAIAVLIGPDHEYRFYNDAYLDLVPVDRVRPGLTVADAFPEAVESAVPLLDRAYGGEAVTLEQLKVPFGGPQAWEGHRYYRGFYRPLLQDGEPVGVLVTAVEITEDIRLRDSLQVQLIAERKLAERMQAALLPASLPEVAGLAFARRYITAREDVGVGGDWYDALPLRDGRVLISMGDISGRGLPAASEMSQVRAAIRAYADAGAPVQDILAKCASLVQTVGLADMITAGVGLLNPATGALSYANAAHLPPLLIPAAGMPEYLPTPSNVPLGLGSRAADFEPVELDLRPGDSFVMFTDGLVEQRGRSLGDTLEQFRLHAGRAPTGSSAEAVAAHLGLFEIDRAAGEDDAAILVVSRTEKV
jgi:PAS domain S-box-containing protein